jgi:hypothetical protein
LSESPAGGWALVVESLIWARCAGACGRAPVTGRMGKGGLVLF